MHLTPREIEKVLIYSMAEIALKRKAKGLKLNHPEAMSVICAAAMDGAREGQTVEDVMRTGTQVPRVAPDTVFSDLMREMSAKGLGAAAVVDGQERPVGIFTDGDLRRRIEAGADLRQATAAQVMHAGPRTIAYQALAVDAAEMMETHGITSVLVVDGDGRLSGIVHIGDLMRAKVI